MPKTFSQLPLVIALALLLLFQAFAYYARLSLSLGPCVILQPWLLRQGYLTYENIPFGYPPLMPILISTLVPVFTDGMTLARVVLVGLITLAALLTGMAAKRHAGWGAGLVAVSFFVIWSPIFGFYKLWFESFLTPIYALLLLYNPVSKNLQSLWSWIAFGLLGGIAIMVKQHAIFVVFALLLWGTWEDWRRSHSFSRTLRAVALFFSAATFPLLVFLAAHYYSAGTLQNFFYWALSFNTQNNVATLAALAPTPNQIAALAPAYMLVPAAVFAITDLRKENDNSWQPYGWAIVLLVASSLTVIPRFGSFHLQPTLPTLAWLSALSLSRIFKIAVGSKRNSLAGGILGAFVILWLSNATIAYQSVFRTVQPRTIAEYSDLVPLANQIREQIGPTDCFYIFPDDESLSNLYYLTRCLPPKFWTFSYPWDMFYPKKSMILSTLKDQQPHWILYAPGRWGIEERAPEIMLHIQEHYRLAAVLPWAQGPVQLLKREN